MASPHESLRQEAAMPGEPSTPRPIEEEVKITVTIKDRPFIFEYVAGATLLESLRREFPQVQIKCNKRKSNIVFRASLDRLDHVLQSERNFKESITTVSAKKVPISTDQLEFYKRPLVQEEMRAELKRQGICVSITLHDDGFLVLVSTSQDGIATETMIHQFFTELAVPIDPEKRSTNPWNDAILMLRQERHLEMEMSERTVTLRGSVSAVQFAEELFLCLSGEECVSTDTVDVSWSGNLSPDKETVLLNYFRRSGDIVTHSFSPTNMIIVYNDATGNSMTSLHLLHDPSLLAVERILQKKIHNVWGMTINVKVHYEELPPQLCEDKTRFIIDGINLDNIRRETFDLYVDRFAEEEPDSVIKSTCDATLTMIVYKKEKEFSKIQKRHAEKPTLQSITTRIRRVILPRRLIVIPNQKTTDTTELNRYLSNEYHSSPLLPFKNGFLATFRNLQDVKRVLATQHKVGDCNLTIYPYYQEFDHSDKPGQIQTSISESEEAAPTPEESGLASISIKPTMFQFLTQNNVRKGPFDALAQRMGFKIKLHKTKIILNALDERASAPSEEEIDRVKQQLEALLNNYVEEDFGIYPDKAESMIKIGRFTKSTNEYQIHIFKQKNSVVIIGEADAVKALKAEVRKKGKRNDLANANGSNRSSRSNSPFSFLGPDGFKRPGTPDVDHRRGSRGSRDFAFVRPDAEHRYQLSLLDINDAYFNSVPRRKALEEYLKSNVQHVPFEIANDEITFRSRDPGSAQASMTCAKHFLQTERLPTDADASFGKTLSVAVDKIRAADALIDIFIEKDAVIVLRGPARSVENARIKIQDIIDEHCSIFCEVPIPEESSAAVRKFIGQRLEKIEANLKEYKVRLSLHSDRIEMTLLNAGEHKTMAAVLDAIEQANMESSIDRLLDDSSPVDEYVVEPLPIPSDEESHCFRPIHPPPGLTPRVTVDEGRAQKVMERRFVHPSRVILVIGQRDIVTTDVDMVINEANRNLEFTSGTASLLMRKGGLSLQIECNNHVKTNGILQLGEVFMTKPGKLPYKAIAHAATYEHNSNVRRNEVLQKAIASCFQIARSENYTSIAIPVADSSQEDSIVALVEVVLSSFQEREEILRQVWFVTPDLDKWTQVLQTVEDLLRSRLKSPSAFE